MTGRNELTTDYLYDSTYGNIVDICEYDGHYTGSYCSLDSSRIRFTDTQYTTPNTSLYIVSAVKQQDVKTNTGVPQRSTRYFYNGSATLGQAPTRPLVTRIDQLTAGTTYITSSTHEYLPNGNIYKERDGRSNETTYSYSLPDAHCPGTVEALLVASIQDPAGHATSYDYGESVGDYGCLFQRPEKITDPNGQATNVRLDSFGRTTQVWEPGDSEASPTRSYFYSWNTGLGGGEYGNGTFTYLKDASGVLWSSSWSDGVGRPVQSRREALNGGSAAGIIIDFAYNAAGQQTEESVPYYGSASEYYSTPTAQYQTTFEYDFLGRVTKLIHSDTSDGDREFAYSANQRVELDERDNKTQYIQDALGRTSAVWEWASDSDPAPRHIAYTYNTLDRVTAVSYYDQTAGNEITYTYDGLGRMTAKSDWNATGSWSYSYCNDGVMSTSTDPRGISIAYKYDSLDRITGKQYFASGQTPPDTCTTALSAPNESYTYDAEPSGLTNGQNVPASFEAGRLSRVTDAVGDHLFSYDARGRLIYERTVTDPTGGTNRRVYNIARTYDSMDRLSTLEYPDSDTATDAAYPGGDDGEILTYTYDGQGNIAKIQTSLGGYYLGSATTSASYTVSDEPLSLPLGNGQTAGYEYWAADLRLKRIHVGNGNLLNLQYSYDMAGNVSQIEDTRVPLATMVDFSYDHRNRLTFASGTFVEQYVYDRNGRMTSKVSDQLTTSCSSHQRCLQA